MSDMTAEARIFTALLKQDGMMMAVAQCIAPIVQNIRRDGFADGFKAGQEAMRKMAAHHSSYMRWDGETMWVNQDAILSLPIEEPQS